MILQSCKRKTKLSFILSGHCKITIVWRNKEYAAKNFRNIELCPVVNKIYYFWIFHMCTIC